MGLINYLNIFQGKMNESFCGFGIIRVYIDDLLIIMKGDWSNHLEKLTPTWKKLKYNGIKCNIEKNSFGQT